LTRRVDKRAPVTDIGGRVVMVSAEGKRTERFNDFLRNLWNLRRISQI